MFLELAHTKLAIFHKSKALVIECYRLSRDFPQDEKFAMVQQIRRASTSVHLNIAEGCSRRSLKERKRFFEISRGSLVEVDTTFSIAHELKYVEKDQLNILRELIIENFKMLSTMIG